MPIEKAKTLLANNAKWAQKQVAENAEIFEALAEGQNPSFLWLGCSDSRVPAEQIVGVGPGTLFVHRNIANIVAAKDESIHAALAFAVDVLGVKNIIVCGHYGCGGVLAAMQGNADPFVDRWVAPIAEVYRERKDSLSAAENAHDRMCEHNVEHQLSQLCQHSVVKRAWAGGQPLALHGWVYRLEDGTLKDLGTTITTLDQAEEFCRAHQ